jgi:addiction module HigA family antidote
MANLTPAPHPGETIREDVLEPLGMSVNQLAKALGITATRLNDVVRGRRGITADTALRLARYLGTSAEFWLGLQLEYDLRTARDREDGPTAARRRLRTGTRKSQLPGTASAHSIRRQISVACQPGASASSVSVLPEKRY